MRAHRKLAAALALAVGLSLAAGCGGDEKAKKKAPAPAVQLLKGQHLAKIAAQFEFRSLHVTLGYAVYDDVTKKLTVSSRWTNPGTDERKVYPYLGLDLPGEEPRSMSSVDGDPTLLPGASADVMLVADVDKNPLKTGTIRFDEEDNRGVRVPLDGSKRDQLTAVREFPLDVWSDIGNNTVHVTSGRVRSFSRDDNDAPEGKRILELDHEAWTSTYTALGFEPAEKLRLVGKDGTILTPVNHKGGGGGIWTHLPDLRVDFEIPEDGAGDYQLWLLRRSPGVFGSPPKKNTYHPVRLTIPKDAFAPPARPGDRELPLPRIAPRPPKEGAEEPKPPKAKDFDLRGLKAVNAGGFVIQPQKLEWNPAEEKAILTAKATFIGFIGEGMFDTDPSLALTTGIHLADGRMLPSAFAAPESFRRDLLTQEATAQFNVDSAIKPSLEGARLLLGRHNVIDLTRHAPPKDKKERLKVAKALPAGVSPRIVDAELVNVGAYKVKILSYRYGQLDRDLPPGRQQLEITYDVTLLHEVKEPAFYYDMFNLARADGYVHHPDGERTAGNLLEVGKPERQLAMFIIDADKQPDRVRLALRSESQRANLFLKGWLTTELTIALTDKPWKKDGREIDGGAGALEELIKDDIVDRATEAGVDKDVAEDAVENLTDDETP